MTTVLTEIEYSEYPGTKQSWILRPTQLQQINLIVALNATGKTRLINVIAALAEILLAARKVREGGYKVRFRSELGASLYEVTLTNGHVTKEKLTIEKEIVLDRQANGRGKIRAKKLNNDMIDFECPPEQLAAVYRRDSIQHPFLQHLHDWASNVKQYRFGTPMGANELFLDTGTAASKENADKERPPASTLKYSNTPLVYTRGWKKFNKHFDEQIIADMNALGYRISDVGARNLERTEYEGPPLAPVYIFVKERDLKTETRQLAMSSGMFRALATIIQLNYWALNRESVTLLIDDIGEGLDHSRSTKLIKLLVKKTQKFQFQLIMTTNDRFVMNSVPLKYWGIMERVKQRVRVLSEAAYPERFEKAQSLGLSNFDVFSRKLYR